jgi:hypothetical protein
VTHNADDQFERTCQYFRSNSSNIIQFIGILYLRTGVHKSKCACTEQVRLLLPSFSVASFVRFAVRRMVAPATTLAAAGSQSVRECRNWNSLPRRRRLPLSLAESGRRRGRIAVRRPSANNTPLPENSSETWQAPAQALADLPANACRASGASP